MSAYYVIDFGAAQTTNATGNTENDSTFVTVGAGASLKLYFMKLMGKATNLTSLSGIESRLKNWPSTSSSGGTAVTPTPTPTATAASKATAGASASAVTSGTGTSLLYGSCCTGVSGSDTWQCFGRDMDDAPDIQSAATKSLDTFVSSPTASMNYTVVLKIAEN